MKLVIEIPESNTKEQVIVLMYRAIDTIRRTTGESNRENTKIMVKLARTIISQVHVQ